MFYVIQRSYNYIITLENVEEISIQIKPTQRQYDEIVMMHLEDFEYELIQRKKKHNFHFKYNDCCKSHGQMDLDRDHRHHYCSNIGDQAAGKTE